MKTYKQRTQDILNKAKKQKQIRKRAWVSAISATACAAVIAISCLLFVPLTPPKDPIDAYKNSEYYSVIKPLNAQFDTTKKAPVYKNNFEKWTAGIKNFFSSKDVGNTMSDSSAIDSTTSIPEYDDGVDTELPPTSNGATENGGYVETTDNQVAGVIEGDLFKRTKTHIFYLCCLKDDGALRGGYPVLRIYTIAGDNSKLVREYIFSPGELGELKGISAQPELYLSDDGKTLTLVHMVVKNQGTKDVARYTEIITLDVSVPEQTQEIGRQYLAGHYVSSRVVGGKLLVVNNFNVNSMPDFDQPASYIPQYGDDVEDLQLVGGEDIIVPETITTKKHTVVMELDQATGEIEDCMALYCYSADMYVSQDNMYFTRDYTTYPEWDRVTEITCVSYGDGFEKQGDVTVKGSVLNQYSMDEYKGVFRVVTTVYRPYTSASIYCVDMETWEIIGSVETFAPAGEDVQSVRFDGDKAYVCTALVVLMTDPVYAFNLSDPTNITYKDTGAIDGYSTSLVQFKDGYLLGIGVNKYNSLKLEIYEETENGVESVCAYEPCIDPQNTWLNIDFSREYKAYFIDRERGLIGLGTWYYEGGLVQQYRLLCFDGYGFSEVFVVDLLGLEDYKRATLIEDEHGNGWFYMLSAEFKVVKIYEKE